MKQSALFLLVAAIPALAHHSLTASYDDKKSVTVRGTVTRFEWTNPHVYIYVDSPGAGGQMTRWEVEFDSTVDLAKAGWAPDSVKQGDVIVAEGSAARDGSRQVLGKTLQITGGKKLMAASRDLSALPLRTAANGPAAPRWPNGHVRLGTAPGEKGYWAAPSPGGLYETSAGSIRMNREGLLANIADSAKVAPFQPWAKGVYEYRQKNQFKEDPTAFCLPPGGPRQFQDRYGVQIVEQPDRNRIFVMSAGANRNWRLIYLDGRALPQIEEVTPTYYGYSVGKWEGDTLVVNALAFAERFWFSNGGLPHTESLKLTERISRPDAGTLKYEVTVDDNGAYTRPWTGGWTLGWVNGDVEEYFCDDNNKETEHLSGKHLTTQ
jgi:hypothetical protein